MHITELTELQFMNYSNIHTNKNYKQSVEYANFEESRGYNKRYLALIDEQNNVHAATLILEKNLNNKFKYGFVPNGYLLNYFNSGLLEIFTKELKIYLRKLNYIYINITPQINYQIYNSNFILLENNSGIINEFKKIGYEYKPNTSKHKMVIKNNEINSTFANFKRSLKRNINDCLKKGITVSKGTPNDIETFLDLIKDKDYYRKMIEYFNNEDNNFEFYIARLNPENYINNYRYLLKKEQLNNDILNKELKDTSKKKTDNLIDKKIISDRLLTKYNKEIINGTNIYKEYPNGIAISAVGIIANNKDVTFIVEGYKEEFKYIRSICLVKWEIIKKHLTNNYQTFDLGDISIKNTYTTKSGFNGNIIEYQNTFDLPINEMLYKLNNFTKKQLK